MRGLPPILDDLYLLGTQESLLDRDKSSLRLIKSHVYWYVTADSGLHAILLTELPDLL